MSYEVWLSIGWFFSGFLLATAIWKTKERMAVRRLEDMIRAELRAEGYKIEERKA